RILGVPVALVSLVEADRQFFTSSVGLPEPWASCRQTPLSHSFCRHVVAAREPLVLADARQHPAFRDNPAIGELGVVAYLGIPLITPEGQALGSFCAIDAKPRAWTDDEVRTMRDLAASVLTEIELRRDRAELGRAIERRTAELTETVARLRRQVEERRRAEEALDRQREFLEAILEHAADGIVACDADGILTLFNRATRAFHGMPAEPIPAARWTEHFGLFRPDGTTRLPAEEVPLYRAWRGESVQDMELVIVPASGPPRTVLASGRAFYDRGGTKLGAVVVMHDITEQRRAARERTRLLAEQAARAEAEAGQRRWHRLTEAILQKVWTARPDGRIEYFNRRWYDYTGQAPEGALGQGWRDAIHPDDLAPAMEQWAAALRTGEDFEVENRLRRASDGSYRWHLARGVPVRDEAGRIVRWLGTSTDIDDRKRVEQELRVSEARFRALVEQSPLSTQILAADGTTLRVNRSWERLWGITLDQIAGYNLLHDEQLVAQDVMPYLQRAVAGEGSAIPACVYYPDRGPLEGQAIWVRAFIYPVKDEAGAVREVVLVHEDITERVRAEEQLHRKGRSLTLLSDNATRLLRDERPEDRLGDLFGELAEHLGVEVFVNHLVSEPGRRLRLNACAGVDEATRCRLQEIEFGQAVRGLVATRGQPLVAEDVQRSPAPEDELARALGISAYACLPLLAHGRVIGTLSLGTRTRTRFEPEELELMRAVCDQVAIALERQRLTSEVRRRAQELAEANAAKDHFLAVLSHELRTPLTPVLMAVSLLLDDPGLPPALRPTLVMARRNVELEARLIDDLLDVTRIAQGKLRLDRTVVDAHALIGHALEICRGELRAAGLRLEVDLAAARSYVRADPARLQQVFWNLIKNAVKFTPQGGTVAVRSRTDPNSAAGDPGGTRLIVEVADSGMGIAPEALPKVFDAFEQGGAAVTRRFGGLGLGLAISRGVVERHGGTLTASSPGVGRGATFTLILDAVPAPQADPTPGPTDRTEARAHAPALRVLLVEDNVDTAQVMARLLAKEGHRVMTAHDLASALAAAEAADFDLLISDLGLPDGSGLDLMRQLRARSALRGIALSGYGMEEDLRQSREAGFEAHLTKPIDVAALGAVVRRVAAGAG
ncbi:MAG TPA: PAS domain S-box protein, partial [Isosphaeraceae bacterium]